MGAAEIEAFLTHLAVERKVVAATQNQALSAIVFLYKHVLEIDAGLFNAVRALMAEISPPVKLLVQVMYGGGLRLGEACSLRVKDIDLARLQITVRRGKRDKHRVTLLSERLVEPLAKIIDDRRKIHDGDLVAGEGWVELPHAFARKAAGGTKIPCPCHRDWLCNLGAPPSICRVLPVAFFGALAAHRTYPTRPTPSPEIPPALIHNQSSNSAPSANSAVHLFSDLSFELFALSPPPPLCHSVTLPLSLPFRHPCAQLREHAPNHPCLPPPHLYPAFVIHEFTNLPPLTTEQANVVAAVLTAGPSLTDMAEATHYDLARFLDLYSSPEVRAHIAAAKCAITDNVTIRLTEAAHTATEVLETLAQDTENDKTERRRAATTILRSILPRPDGGGVRRVRESDGGGANAQDAFDYLVRSLVQPGGAGFTRPRESDGASSASSPVPTGEVSDESASLTEAVLAHDAFEHLLRSVALPDRGGVRRVRESDTSSPSPENALSLAPGATRGADAPNSSEPGTGEGPLRPIAADPSRVRSHARSTATASSQQASKPQAAPPQVSRHKSQDPTSRPQSRPTERAPP